MPYGSRFRDRSRRKNRFWNKAPIRFPPALHMDLRNRFHVAQSRLPYVHLILRHSFSKFASIMGARPCRIRQPAPPLTVR